MLRFTLAKLVLVLCAYSLVDSKQCGNNSYSIYSTGVSQEDIKTILDLHNLKRQEVASGNCKSQSGDNFPKACNMTKMVWDDTLAAWAQIHSDGCMFEHWNPARQNHSYLGQNLFLKWSSSKEVMEKPDWNWAVGYWNNESALFNVSDIAPYQFSHESGHFTQVVWAKTYKVGCGATWYENTTDTAHPYRTLYTCQYWPGGNFINRTMYATKDCDQCHLDKTYPDLCIVQ